MKPDPNFPRMMFHRTKEPVIVNSQAELEALGREWGYRPGATDVPEEEPEEAPEEHEEPAPKPQPPPVRPPARVPVHAETKARKKRAHR